MQSMHMFSYCVMPTLAAALAIGQTESIQQPFWSRRLRPMALAWHNPPASPNQGIAGSTLPDKNDTNEQ